MSIEFEQLFMDRPKGGTTANIKAVASPFVVFKNSTKIKDFMLEY